MSTGIIFSGNIINPGNVIYLKNMNYQADAKFLWVREHRYVIYSARIHGFFFGKHCISGNHKIPNDIRKYDFSGSTFFTENKVFRNTMDEEIFSGK